MPLSLQLSVSLNDVSKMSLIIQALPMINAFARERYFDLFHIYRQYRYRSKCDLYEGAIHLTGFEIDPERSQSLFRPFHFFRSRRICAPYKQNHEHPRLIERHSVRFVSQSIVNIRINLRDGRIIPHGLFPAVLNDRNIVTRVPRPSFALSSPLFFLSFFPLNTRKGARHAGMG